MLSDEWKKLIKEIRKAYKNKELPENICLDIADIDHTIEGTKSLEETIKFYNKFIRSN